MKYWITSLALSVGILTMTNSFAQVPEFPEVENLPIEKGLHDPFTTFGGKKITTPDDWYSIRRPELKNLIQHYMYGFAPDAPGIEVSILSENPSILGGEATYKEIEIRFKGLPEDAPKMRLSLFVPNDRNGPVPVFLGINKCGNHTILEEAGIEKLDCACYHKSCDKPGYARAKENFWCVDYLISRGYALANFHESDIDVDKHDFTDGIHAQFTLPHEPGAQWGTIRAWAWGFHRAVDYLVTDPDINREQIAVIGHSRRGKTVLLATALDERIALVVPHQSGTGGDAISRDSNQETVKRINDNFPHWFNDNFTKFNDNEYRIPFDQHLVMALVAPRALLDTGGIKDRWANYPASLRAIQAASPVYEFLGAKGIVGEGMVNGENDKITEENASTIMQFRLNTKHTLNQDYWAGILDFADIQFGR